MKFGVREICDVVLKAKANQKIGNKMFYKNEPVIYFDTLKTSSMEGSATTVYAQGGRGNARLMAWEGERTVTFTMEDALISPEGFMILSGAGLIEAGEGEDGKPITIKQHMTQTLAQQDVKYDYADTSTSTPAQLDIPVSYEPYEDGASGEHYIYVFLMKDGEITTEPYIGYPVQQYLVGNNTWTDGAAPNNEDTRWIVRVGGNSNLVSGYTPADLEANAIVSGSTSSNPAYKFDSVLVDYYTERTSGAKQIEITADKFGGNYYLEASTLFRTQAGVDMPAEFIIPNCKIQSNFNFSMASSGDPSTFTFTMDAFPDYTRFDKSKKVLAAIQIIEEDEESDTAVRTQTWA